MECFLPEGAKALRQEDSRARVFFQKIELQLPSGFSRQGKSPDGAKTIVPSCVDFLYGNRAPVAQDLKDLLPGVLAGDKKSWDAFVRTYSPLVYRMLGKFSSLSPSEREDLTQDVFLLLLDRGIRQFHGSTPYEFAAYIRMITQNEAKSHLRRHGRRFELNVLDQESDDEDDRPAIDPAAGRSSDPEEMTLDAENRRALLGCIQTIPEVDQEIFWMRQREDSYDEISQMLGLPTGTIASKFHRAKASIEDCLKRAGVL
jgi:RNA polymerase sigma factor (sigma-70 family)